MRTPFHFYSCSCRACVPGTAAPLRNLCPLCRMRPGEIEPRGADKFVCLPCALDLPVELLNGRLPAEVIST